MPKKLRVFSVEDIRLHQLESDPPKLSVAVTGLATSSGWTEVELAPLEKTLSADGILDLEFVGTPPKDVFLPVMTPVAASYVWHDDVSRLVGVNIHTRSGETLELIDHGYGQVGGSGAEAMAAAHFTTLMVGEEGGPLPTTLRLGEEGRPPTTKRLGEEGPLPTTKRLGEEGPFPTTKRLGEEGPQPTTLRLGEEGPQPTTLITGEEGPTTLVFGEENPGPTTFAWGEEGPNTGFVGEDGPKPYFGESDPRGESGTGAFGEDFDVPDFDDFNPFGNR